jgi:hypothetical protein
MNDAARPGKPAPFNISRCESMSLQQLGRLIHDALLKRSVSQVPTDGSIPLSPQEFSDLVRLMEAKAEAQKEDFTVPPRPVYDGPASPRTYSYHGALEAACRERNQVRERLKSAREFRAGQNRIQLLREELRKAKRAILAVEDARERNEEEYRQRRRDYDQARELHERDLLAWERAAANVKRRRKAHDGRKEIVNRARRRVARAFKPKSAPEMQELVVPEMQELIVPEMQEPIIRDFEIARPDEQGDEHVLTYLEEVMGEGRLPGEWSQDRYDKMCALPRSNWQKGKAGWYGYIAIMFPHTEKVVLECPVEGNAIYVLDTGEDRLLKMSKRHLRESGEAKRIFHTGDNWYRRLKDELGIE